MKSNVAYYLYLHSRTSLIFLHIQFPSGIRLCREIFYLLYSKIKKKVRIFREIIVDVRN